MKPGTFNFYRLNLLLLFIAITLGIFYTGCTNSYKTLQSIPGTSDCVRNFKPDFSRALYKTRVDVLRHHLSGLLFIKLMPDSSTRILFTTETGFKFFDFEFAENNDFKVHYIFDKMNRKAVIRTLRDDFELALMQPLLNSQPQLYMRDGLLYHLYKQKGDYNYYITDSSCTDLIRIEKASRRKLKMAMIMNNYENGTPDTIGISHKNFSLSIGLKKLDPIRERQQIN